MNFSVSDLLQIKSSVLLLLFVLCAGGTAIAASEYFAAHAQRKLHDMQRQHGAARKQLAAAYADHQDIETYTVEYEGLRRRNIIGDEHRLDWIEGLQNIRQQQRVLDFKYTIAPQQAYAQAPPDNGNFDLKLSGMTLHFDLLHEQQLMDFFDALRTDIDGRFILDHCVIERTRTETDDEQPISASAAPLKAECAGGWLTLQHRNAT